MEWVCKYPFSVLVPGKKNFAKKFISGVQPGPGQMYSAKHKVDLLDEADYYPYHVAVAKDDEKTMLVLLSASPDIIIRDR